MGELKTKLKPYLGHDGNQSELAVLVFAHSSKEAKPLAYAGLCNFHNVEYIDVRVKLYRDKWMYAHAAQKALLNNNPHVIESPVSCEGCYMWGIGWDDNGVCDWCCELAHYPQWFVELANKWGKE